MLIIPVIDLYQGRAVHAVGGRREHYQPVSTPLCSDADPGALLQAYLSLHHFATVYIADIDAILGKGSNHLLIERLLEQFPTIELWLDAGFSRIQMLEGWMHMPRLRPVLGSESQRDSHQVKALLAQAAIQKPILSLDFKHRHFLGPRELLAEPAAWPDDVIVMRLDRVGNEHGPDTALPRGHTAPGKRLYAAGGIRDRQDLEALTAKGFYGALLASALLNARISATDIAALSHDESDSMPSPRASP